MYSIDLNAVGEDRFTKLNKLGDKAIEIFCDSLGNLTTEEINSPDFIEILTKEIVNNQSDFISNVFKWQRNITSKTFKEYSEYLKVVSSVLEVLENK